MHDFVKKHINSLLCDMSANSFTIYIWSSSRLLAKETDEDRGIRTMKNTSLLAAVKKRFSDVEKNPLYCIASLVDPRYTDRFFSNTNTAREAKVMVIQELQKLSGGGQQEEHEEPPIRRLRRDQPSSSLDSVFDEIADEHVSLSSTPVAAAIQLETYLAEATVSREDKPLQYWVGQSQNRRVDETILHARTGARSWRFTSPKLARFLATAVV
ncbi:hypothetical protein AAFF_G00061750 [Aldrovandia affinis]|uniref:Uncharacterized protein n=1 Tax=Aldrovandia affinis TaxID=143900 RepID=A0AAD7R1U2_9TELE|nr:hypothetical protein AAFF_G00061750 [Aldrovandia affinis]